MDGRKPLPTAIRMITGNRSREPLNDAEPQPEGEVVKPAHVKGRAAKVWNQYSPQLIAQGVLTAWDVDMFAMWCCLTAEFQKDPDSFYPAKLSQVRALASCFGLEPSSRSRLKSGGKAEPSSKVSKYVTKLG